MGISVSSAQLGLSGSTEAVKDYNAALSICFARSKQVVMQLFQFRVSPNKIEVALNGEGKGKLHVCFGSFWTPCNVK